MVENIFVVGAGTMGNGIAQTAATSGFSVILMDVIPEQLERARETIARSSGKLLEKGAITQEQQQAASAIPLAG